MRVPELQSTPPVDPLQQYLSQWMSEAPEQLVTLLRCAALPHKLDRTLVETLAAIAPDVQMALWTRLIASGFVTQTPSREFVLLPLVRQPIITLWQVIAPANYRQINAIAAEYLDRSQPSSSIGEPATNAPIAEWRLERLFFLLGADDEAGLHEFTTLFEQAWQQHQYHQIEQLLVYGQEQTPILQPATRRWLCYFQARYAIGNQQYQSAEATIVQTLRDLVAGEERLRAHSLESLAEIEAETKRWSDALQHYQQSLNWFTKNQEKLVVLRLLEAIALTYARFSTAIGGLPEENYNQTSQSYWRLLYHAPFLLYRFCSRRARWLPNLYFGTNYQDWIIVRLLMEATRYFEHALRQSAAIGSLSAEQQQMLDQRRIELQIRLADLYYRLNRWSKAEIMFQLLAQHPLVTNDAYRQANLDLSQGRAALLRRQSTKATEHLSRAKVTFLHYREGYTLQITNQLLGDSAWNQRHYHQAIEFYVQSVNVALEYNDLLSATHGVAILNKLSTVSSLAPEQIRRIDELKDTIDRYAFVERFPANLLKIFRRLIIWCVLPLTYILTTLLLLILLGLIGNIEFLSQSNASVFDFIVGFSLLGGIPLLLVWLFEGLYVTIGAIFVRWLPIKLLLRNRPLYIAVFNEAVYVQDEGYNDASLQWKNIQGIITNDRTLQSTPLSLFSQTILHTSTRKISVEGILSHYQLFKELIFRKFQLLERVTNVENLTISYLRSRWTILAFGLAFLLNIISLSGWLDREGEGNIISVQIKQGQFHDLYLVSFFTYFYFWVLPLLSLSAIARTLYSRYQVRQRLGTTLELFDFVLILFLLFFLLLLFLIFRSLLAEPPLPAG